MRPIAASAQIAVSPAEIFKAHGQGQGQGQHDPLSGTWAHGSYKYPD